ncbi:MAG: dienelactone hydrolase family protein, partial [Caldilineaceae bacterium]|nr:dienelactone hydrolase family protein [Caldilineaceae bacterium]
MQPILGSPISEPTHALFDASVPVSTAILHAQLRTPATPSGWVIIGYSRQYRHFAMPDNPFGGTGLATMHVQLLPLQSSATNFDSEALVHLTQQLIDATRWLRSGFDSGSKPIGLFGAYQDAGVALSAAAFLGNEVDAVVSFQGRPDKSMNHLAAIQAPTLLLVNQEDQSVLTANVQARWWLRCTHQLSLVPGRLRLLREKSSFQM